MRVEWVGTSNAMPIQHRPEGGDAWNQFWAPAQLGYIRVETASTITNSRANIFFILIFLSFENLFGKFGTSVGEHRRTPHRCCKLPSLPGIGTGAGSVGPSSGLREVVRLSSENTCCAHSLLNLIQCQVI